MNEVSREEFEEIKIAVSEEEGGISSTEYVSLTSGSLVEWFGKVTGMFGYEQNGKFYGSY